MRAKRIAAIAAGALAAVAFSACGDDDEPAVPEGSVEINVEDTTMDTSMDTSMMTTTPGS